MECFFGGACAPFGKRHTNTPCFSYHSTNVLKLQTFVCFFWKKFLNLQIIFLFLQNMTNFSIDVNNLFIFYQYSNICTRQEGCRNPSDGVLYTPSSSNPSIRESPGTATGAFPIFLFLRHGSLSDFASFHKRWATIHTSACIFFCRKKACSLCFCDFSQKYAYPKNEFLQRGTCISRFIVVK